ncbi:MAG: SagB/ThcOx family dehydrogenase [Candidatus Krumholzibacteriota bacterium]|nr:SagB/ThcOx family dehydrogenase [Candidatus Krumholzibacteriota bacterium]
MDRDLIRAFMKATRHENMAPSAQQRGAPMPPAFAALGSETGRVALPPPADLDLALLDFPALLARRASRRRFTEAPLDGGQLSFLLWATQGRRGAGDRLALRTVPSAGARHAFETLLDVRRVDGLEAGLYQYEPMSHALLVLAAEPDLAGRVTRACYDQACVAGAAAVFLWAAVPERMTWRYGERGYRYLHLDAGHVCQNLYLACEALGLGTCAVAAFDDGALDAALGLDGEEAFALYLAPVGRL